MKDGDGRWRLKELRMYKSNKNDIIRGVVVWERRGNDIPLLGMIHYGSFY